MISEVAVLPEVLVICSAYRFATRCLRSKQKQLSSLPNLVALSCAGKLSDDMVSQLVKEKEFSVAVKIFDSSAHSVDASYGLSSGNAARPWCSFFYIFIFLYFQFNLCEGMYWDGEYKGTYIYDVDAQEGTAAANPPPPTMGRCPA